MHAATFAMAVSIAICATIASGADNLDMTDAKRAYAESLDDARFDYLSARKLASLRLLQIYKKNIKRYEEEHNGAMARLIEKEMQRFIEAETPILQGLEKKSIEEVFSKVKNDAPNPMDKPKPPKKGERLDFEKFSRDLNDGLTEASRLGTQAKREDATRKFIKKLLERIEGEILPVSYHIEDVERRDKKYVLKLNAPETPLDIVYSPREFETNLSKKRAVKINRGDVAVFSGEVIIVKRQHQLDTRKLFFCFTIRSPEHKLYSIYLARPEYHIEKQHKRARNQRAPIGGGDDDDDA